MKKVLFLIVCTVLISSCATGGYFPNAFNNYGTQTTVVLDRANFRIVKNVEAVVEVTNINLKRRDVEKSAYAELVHRNKLTGSQAFINVSIEEIRRESKLSSTRKQFVAARATIIEFVQENGEPLKSVASTEYETVLLDQTNTEKEQGDAMSVNNVSFDSPNNTCEVLAFANNTLTKLDKESEKSFTVYRRPLKAQYNVAKEKPTVEAISALNSITSLIDSLITKRTNNNKLVNELRKPKKIEEHIQILVDYANKEGF